RGRPSGVILPLLTHPLGPFPVNEPLQPQKFGWGGRIRTSEWRDQNPLPYHLATPQLESTVSEPARLKLSQSLIFQAKASRSVHEPKTHQTQAAFRSIFHGREHSFRK